MNTKPRKRPAGQSGMTLIELMIAMTLGLLLLLGLTNVYVAQRQAYRSNDNLAHMLSNGRVASELLAREIRESGLNPCGAGVVANELINANTSAWLNWDAGGIQGYGGAETLPGVTTGTATEERVAGTDAVILRSGTIGTPAVIASHAATSSAIQLNTTDHGYATGDILMACDYKRAAIFLATTASSSSASIAHASGSGTGKNCDAGFPSSCGAGGGHVFATNGMVSKLTVTAWYVGNNSRGGHSLFRIVNGGTPQEIAEGVANLQLWYLTRAGTSPAADYVVATSVTSWLNSAASPVIAVRVVVDLESTEMVGIDETSGDLTHMERQIMQVVSRRGYREILL
jgi:type IV pilus assembly protein PilW